MKWLYVYALLLFACNIEEERDKGFVTVVLSSDTEPHRIINHGSRTANNTSLTLHFKETPRFHYVINSSEYKYTKVSQLVQWLNIGDTIRVIISKKDYIKIINTNKEFRLSSEESSIKVYGLYSKSNVFLSKEKVDEEHLKITDNNNAIAMIYLIIIVLSLCLAAYKYFDSEKS